MRFFRIGVLFSFQVRVVSHRNCKRTSQSAGLSSIKGLIVSSGHVGIVDGKPAALGKEPVAGQDTAPLNYFFVLSCLTLFSPLLRPCEKIREEEGNQSKDIKRLAVLCENVPDLQRLIDQLHLTLLESFTFNIKVIKTLRCQVFVGFFLTH